MVARLAGATRQELLTFDDPSSCVSQGVPERMLRHAAACVRQAAAQVPTLRQITSPQGLAHDADLDTIQWRNGGQARLIEQIPFRLAVFDRTTAVIPLDLDVFYNGMLVIRDPAVVRALTRTHHNSWTSGDDLVTDREPDRPPPTWPRSWPACGTASPTTPPPPASACRRAPTPAGSANCSPSSAPRAASKPRSSPSAADGSERPGPPFPAAWRRVPHVRRGYPDAFPCPLPDDTAPRT
ncbi:hypothetical protein ACFQY7_28315 [Actinomadura luteofluorescens]|uniref:hypothetical protein n=1 Tax=Actinomadura luteofluorescens TaxID=46163 RepID=UPI00362D4652